MERLFLHIGTHKTGSTSIQKALIENSQALSRNGFYVPKTGSNEDGNHSEIAWAFSGDSRAGDENILSELLLEIQEKPGKTIIISGEEFEYLDQESIRRVRSFFSNYEVKVICYLRPQVDLIRSEYVEWIKQGLASDNFSVFWRLQATQERYNYLRLYNLWKEVFGSSFLEFRSYDDTKDYSHGVIEDFWHCIGIPSDVVINVKNHNKSPSDETVRAWLLAMKYLELTTGVDYSVADYMYRETDRCQRVPIFKVLRQIQNVVESDGDNSRFIGYKKGEDFGCMLRFEETNLNLERELGKKIISYTPIKCSENRSGIKKEVISKVFGILEQSNLFNVS